MSTNRQEIENNSSLGYSFAISHFEIGKPHQPAYADLVTLEHRDKNPGSNLQGQWLLLSRQHHYSDNFSFSTLRQRIRNLLVGQPNQGEFLITESHGVFAANPEYAGHQLVETNRANQITGITSVALHEDFIAVSVHKPNLEDASQSQTELILYSRETVNLSDDYPPVPVCKARYDAAGQLLSVESLQLAEYPIRLLPPRRRHPPFSITEDDLEGYEEVLGMMDPAYPSQHRQEKITKPTLPFGDQSMRSLQEGTQHGITVTINTDQSSGGQLLHYTFSSPNSAELKSGHIERVNGTIVRQHEEEATVRLDIEQISLRVTILTRNIQGPHATVANEFAVPFKLPTDTYAPKDEKATVYAVSGLIKNCRLQVQVNNAAI